MVRVGALLSWSGVLLSMTTSAATAGELRWGRPQVVTHQQTQAAGRRGTPMMRDSRIVTATWEEEDARDARTNAMRDRNIDQNRAVNEVSGPDSFPADRLAQLPGNESIPDNDPFDEPIDAITEEITEEHTEEFTEEFTEESADQAMDELEPSESDSEMDPELDADGDIEASIQDEIHRRQIESDLFEDDGAKELFGDDPLEVPVKSDPFGDEDWLKDAIEKTEGLLQGKQGSREGSAFEPTEKEAAKLREQLARERKENDKNCSEEIARIRESGIEAIDISIRLTGSPGEDFPYECALGNEPLPSREWPLITYNWKASALCHKPLYFEQVQLERYGHSWGPYVQPIMSGVHFFGSVPVLPYKMGVRTPCECVYALGYYRPGNCAPYMIDPVPLSLRGALFQAGAVTGISAVIP